MSASTTSSRLAGTSAAAWLDVEVAPSSTRSGSVGLADADRARRVEHARAVRDAHRRLAHADARRLTSVRPRGQRQPAQVEVHAGRRRAGTRAQLGDGRRPVARARRRRRCRSRSAAETTASGMHEHDHREDEPSRPAQQPGARSGRSPAKIAIAAIAGAAAERGDQADAGGGAERGDEREQRERGARDRPRRVVAALAAEGRGRAPSAERAARRRRRAGPGRARTPAGASIVERDDRQQRRSSTIVVIRERPSIHAGSPSSVGRNASSAR